MSCGCLTSLAAEGVCLSCLQARAAEFALGVCVGAVLRLQQANPVGQVLTWSGITDA